ncbi:MAG: family 10 glycosylhydrolase [Cyanobacteria bacterium P01_E01_bin.6]
MFRHSLKESSVKLHQGKGCIFLVVQDLEGVESVVWLPFHFLQSHHQLIEAQARQQLRINGLIMAACVGAIVGNASPAFSADVGTAAVKEASSIVESDRRTISLGIATETIHDDWRSPISNRLDRIHQSFQFVDWDHVRQLDDVREFDVLFLPNIQTVTQRQFRVLERWIDDGGQLIVSGNLGESSSSIVQAQLRSLLGAYWAFELPETSRLQVSDRHPLADEMTDASAMNGGIIVPTRLGSQTLATWQTSPDGSIRQSARGNGFSRRINVGATGAPAIIETGNTTFLGWHWGRPGEANAAFDSAWLQSVLPNRHLDLDATPPLISRQQSVPSPSSDTHSASAPAVAVREASTDVASSATGDRSTATSTPSSRNNEQTIGARLPLAPVSDEEFVDPTQQIAPAGLEVQQDERPIHILEKLSMTREIENLIGRFESALLASQVHGASQEEDIGQVDSILIASTTNQLGIAQELTNSSEINTYAHVMNHPALVQAKALLEEFPGLVNERRYGEARQNWLEARQLLWENFPTDRPIAQPEVRAIWLDRGTIVRAGSRERLAEIFDQLAIAGINTVFVETVNAGYPIYPSEIAPEQNPLIHGWDPLDAAVDLAHEHGIEAHAWVWVFAAGNQRHNTIADLPWNYPGPILAAHPTWANADRQGRAIPVGQDKPFLDPANPEVRQYLQQLYEEIVTRYDVDGLHLDYIRYPFQNAASGQSYGYGAASRQQFQQLTGVDPLTLSPNNRGLWQQWTDFRTEQVNSFVAETAQNLHDLRPDIVLSAAVFAMSEHERIQKLQQHWEEWAREGTIDMIVTMSYASDTNRFQQLTSPWLLEAELGSTLVVPGIQLFNLSEAAAFDQIQSLRDTPAGGYALFAAEHLNDDLRSIFNRTQGTEEIPLAPIPFREPFTTASARFDALQHEWNFLLDNGVFWMRSTKRDEMRLASEEMQAILNDLSDDASARDIQQAQESFEQFTSQFEEWTYLQSFSHSYRVESWQHRLDMIDLLLSYGGDRL